MPLTIQDNDEAYNAVQATWMQTDIYALVSGIAGEGVLTGCAVTAQGTPNMTVAVAAGEVLIAGSNVPVTAGNGTITTAHASNPRIDLVTISSAGAIVVTAGTAAANPKAPDVPASSVLLAMVYVPAAATAITSSPQLITDKRLPVGGGAIPSGRSIGNFGTNLVIPGVDFDTNGTRDISANTLYYTPVMVLTPITIDQMVIEVTVAGAGGTLARLGVYRAGTNWQPTSLVLDAGTVAISSTGMKTATVSLTLQPGRYLNTIVANGAPQLRMYRGGSQYMGVYNGGGGGALLYMARVSSTYAALASTGVTWNDQQTTSTSFENFILYRISTA